MDNCYKQAMKAINKSQSIYISAHVNPDGDAIGSAMAMYLALKNMGKDVSVVIPLYADKFNFLTELNEAKDKINVNEYDLLIALDVSNFDRLAIPEEDIKKARDILVIDHHVKNSVQADTRILDEYASATCQLVYEFFENQNIPIDKNIAKYLYMGMLTDTGSFNYQNTTPKTHRIVANLLETEFDFAYICKKINDTVKESKLKLLAHAIDNIETFENGKIKYVKIDFNTLQKLEISEEDAEGIVNSLRAIEGVEVAIYVRELENGNYKFSMRSNTNIDVANIAILFNGGGHKKAAGFTCKGNINEVKDELIRLIGVNL